MGDSWVKVDTRQNIAAVFSTVEISRSNAAAEIVKSACHLPVGEKQFRPRTACRESRPRRDGARASHTSGQDDVSSSD
jgi:hypothetical protein